MGEGTVVIGYVRLSKEEAGRGVGLSVQRKAIRDECERRGWLLLRIEEDNGVSGATAPAKRPGLAAALASLDSGEAHVLVVSKLDRLTRSLSGLVHVLERSGKGDWQLVALDLGVDTTTPMGEAMVGVAVVFAQLERRLIGQRTRDALAVKREQGVHVGRASTLDPQVRRRIRGLRKRGHGYSEIARRLNADGVATGQGGKRWYPAAVRVIAGDFDPDAPKRRRNRAAA